MYRRKVMDTLLEWKSTMRGETALLIEGARRTGKSTIAEEFARNEYESYLLIDWARADDDVKAAFIDNRNNIDALLMYLQAIYGKTLTPRKSLVVFDEVQRFPQAREMIKYLVADGRFDYLETGSLISIKRNVEDIVIPSEEESVFLCPLDFEEWLWALGEEPLAGLLRVSFDDRKPLPDALHRKAMRMWREYLLVGGMPQVVRLYDKNRDLGRVDREKRAILRLYKDDITRFAEGERGRVSAIFSAIPGQLSRHEKRFKLAAINKNARMREYEGAFFWLKDSGIANVCLNATDPTVGLAMSQENATLKCYMGDTGLLVAQSFADRATTPSEVYRDILLDKLAVNEGMLVENAVAQQLRASGHELFFFSRSSVDRERRMEIDFLVAREYDDAAGRLRVSPIEVKSGSGRYATSSLDKFKRTFDKRIGTSYVLHPKPLRVEGDRVFLPLYMAHLL